MNQFRILFCLAIATMAFTLTTATSIANAMPAQVLIIRHAEKPTPEGQHLSERGRERAQALVEFFETNSSVTRFGTPVAIFAATPRTLTGGSVRAPETVAPLAAALGLKLHGEFTREEVPQLVAEIQSNHDYDGKMVLICWEHAMIPEIAAHFGVSVVPSAWDSTVFDRVWEIDFIAAGVGPLVDLPQHVLPGDSI